MNLSEYQNMGPGAYAIATPVEPSAPVESPSASSVKKMNIPTAKATATVVAAEPINVGSSTTNYDMNDPTLTRNPMMMRQCPNCNCESRTRIETQPTWHSFALAIFLLFIFWPICWIPLILDTCKRTNHYCVLCNTKVGVIEPFHDCCVEKRG